MEPVLDAQSDRDLTPLLLFTEMLTQEQFSATDSDATQLTGLAPPATPQCQICQNGTDDLHHMLIECLNPMICAQHNLILQQLQRQ